MLHTGQAIAQLAHRLRAIQRLACVIHAIHRNQYFRLNLLEAIQHRWRAHVGRAHAPHRTNAHAGKAAHYRLGNIRQIGRHAIPPLNAHLLQANRERGNLGFQLWPAQLTYIAQFIFADDRCHARCMRRTRMAQHLRCVINLRTGKPLRLRHPVIAQGRTVGRGRLQLKVIPNRLPKRIQIGDRPLPQRVVTVKAQAAFVF